MRLDSDTVWRPKKDSICMNQVVDEVYQVSVDYFPFAPRIESFFFQDCRRENSIEFLFLQTHDHSRWHST